MSGTSLDGVDVAVVDFAEFPPRLLHSATTAYSASLRRRLQDLCQSANTTLDALYSLDAELGEIYAESVNRALQQSELEADQVSALGCHGQTIRHRPDATTPYTAQIGDPNRLTALTGITTVADFRRKDLALGGQAAPLAPAFHRFLFHSNTEDRVLINIGGIANITHLPKNPTAAVYGFDTGPGNTLLDGWIEIHQSRDYDKSGDWARGGECIDELLQAMLETEAYFSAAIPKSTGTEYFNGHWLETYLRPDYAAQDVQATLVELTAQSIASSILQQAPAGTACFVCGGGAHNDFLLERLAHKLPKNKLTTTAELGLAPDFVEATAFAWLARERLNRRPGNIPEVTQASGETILGGIYLPD